MKKLDAAGEKVPFEKAFNITKIIMFVNAGLLIIQSIVRFLYIKQMTSFAGFCLTVYLLGFAAIFIMLELSLLNMRVWFFFLNFGWGKGLALFFISTLVMGSGITIIWLDVLFGVIYFIQSLLLPIMSTIYRGQEYAKVEQLLKDVEEQKKEKAANKEKKPKKKPAEGAENRA